MSNGIICVFYGILGQFRKYLHYWVLIPNTCSKRKSYQNKHYSNAKQQSESLGLKIFQFKLIIKCCIWSASVSRNSTIPSRMANVQLLQFGALGNYSRIKTPSTLMLIF